MPRGILRDIGLDESEEDSDVTLAVPDFAAAAEQNAVAQDVTFDVACSPDDSSPPPRPSPTSPQLIAAFNGVNFDILPDVETLQSDVFTSEQIRELCGKAMPDPQHATIPAAFDIQTYVDSVLQKSMQEETKGVSNWLKAHRLRSELLEWCLAPGKAVSEVSKTMR
eukprot:gene6791-8114_t